MFENPVFILLAGLVPMVVGSVYYGPLFGKSWMNVNGFKEEDLEKGNMAVILGLSYLLSCIFALGLSGLCIHQMSVMQLFATHPDFETPGSVVNNLYSTIMDGYGERHRTFGHGAVHGAINAVMITLPLIGINALFERRGWKYIGIHFGYWLITMVLMCGVLCHFL